MCIEVLVQVVLTRSTCDVWSLDKTSQAVCEHTVWLIFVLLLSPNDMLNTHAKMDSSILRWPKSTMSRELLEQHWSCHEQPVYTINCYRKIYNILFLEPLKVKPSSAIAGEFDLLFFACLREIIIGAFDVTLKLNNLKDFLQLCTLWSVVGRWGTILFFVSQVLWQENLTRLFFCRVWEKALQIDFATTATVSGCAQYHCWSLCVADTQTNCSDLQNFDKGLHQIETSLTLYWIVVEIFSLPALVTKM